jgi:hypothetical protein
MLTPTSHAEAAKATQRTTLPDRTATNVEDIRSSGEPRVSPSGSMNIERAVTSEAAGTEATHAADLERAEPPQTVLQRFLDNRAAALTREINTEELADVMNTYRSHPQAKGFDHGKSVAQHNEAISYEGHQRLAGSVTVPAGRFRAAEVAAAWAGGQVPLGTIGWSGVVGYEIAPHATAGADTPWAGAGASLGAAVLIAPGSAVTQPAVVPFQEGPRGQAAPSLKGKPKIKELKHTVASNIKAQAATTDTHTAQFESQLRAWSTEKEMGPIPTDLTAQVAHLTTLYESLTEAQKEQWGTMSGVRDEDRKALFELRNEMAGITTLTNREAGARYFQGISRFVRGVSGIFNPLMLEKTNLSSESVTRIATGIAGFAILAQFPLAAADERFGALKGDRIMAMQFADVFNERGNADWEAGQPVTAEGIDEDKARANVYRDTVLVRADTIVKLAEYDLGKLLAEHGPIDSLPEGDLRTRLERFALDIANLKSTRTDIDEPGADMMKLILESEHPRNFRYVLHQAGQRLGGGDFLVQLAERIAAVISLFFLGSGATLAAGRVTNAAQGGSDHVPFQRAMGLAGLVGGIALMAAYTVYCSSVIKAHTRDRGDIGFFKQTVMGTFAPLILLYGLAQEHGVPLLVEGAMPRVKQSVEKDEELVSQAVQVLQDALSELRELGGGTLPEGMEEIERFVEIASEGGTTPKIFPSSPDVAGVAPAGEREGSSSPQALDQPESSTRQSTVAQLQEKKRA